VPVRPWNLPTYRLKKSVTANFIAAHIMQNGTPECSMEVSAALVRTTLLWKQ
jgi:hypothetical protein